MFRVALKLFLFRIDFMDVENDICGFFWK